MTRIQSIRLDGFLSFAPGTPAFELQPLNVLIGPNGSGKTNLIEAFELLRSTPTDFAAAIKAGDGPGEWIWKGTPPADSATIEVVLDETNPAGRPQRYRLEFSTVRNRIEILDEITWAEEEFDRIQLFREWSFGRFVNLRTPQLAHLPHDVLLPDASNLALVLSEIENRDGARFNDMLRRFYPHFERMTTRIDGGAVRFYLHEPDFGTAIPATRLSDGTLRFLAILALLLALHPPAFACIEKPELGLHPDAVAQLGELLIEASSRTQLVVTTHSESLVSALTECPEAVIACERPGSATELTRLDRATLEPWMEDGALGDLWGIGVLGANP